jgi:hypothetical protein
MRVARKALAFYADFDYMRRSIAVWPPCSNGPGLDDIPAMGASSSQSKG